MTNQPTRSRHLTILTGASRGMGLAMARQLCNADAIVLCLSRGASEALTPWASRNGALLTQWSADLADAAPVAARLGQWLAQQDPSRLASATLINNARIQLDICTFVLGNDIIGHRVAELLQARAAAGVRVARSCCSLRFSD